MNILMVGSGKGSWVMRGQQLGAAMGARVTTSPTDADFAWCDVVVLVKKHAVDHAQRAHKAGKPIVWDALDFWSQPAQNGYNEASATFALQSHIRVIKPALMIGATKAMADAARKFIPAAYLPHHSWAGLVPTPPRDVVTTVAYEGNPAYLGRWHGWLTEACANRGWSFVVNPSNLADADILVAFRDGPWDGWICREWKSGVKLVNAIAAARPIMSQRSAAFLELPMYHRPVEDRATLEDDLDHWSKWAHRDGVYRLAHQHHAAGLTLDAVTADYLRILEKVATCTV